MSLIDFADAACQRGGRLLWRGVSLSLDAGSLVHVTGTNGCGKSSLLRIAAGLLSPVHGAVRRHVSAGLVDEVHALDPDQPLFHGLAFWAAIAGGDVSAASAMCATGLDALAAVPPRLFSTGQRKRAALARLLVEDRRLWLLDEPANGLDDNGIAMLADLVAAHRAAGGAVLLASHQPLPFHADKHLALADFRP